jgi:ketosteroid isomerase-like protein
MGAEAPALASRPGAAAIDAFFAALSRGDIAAARTCCTEDVRIWHGFDRLEQDLDQAAEGWTRFIATFPERDFVDVRRSATSNGYVQQHLMVASTPGGPRLAWPVCVLVRVRDGRIARLDEYMDRAGSYRVVDDKPRTPGLPQV